MDKLSRLAERMSEGPVRPTSAADEVRDALTSARSLAHQVRTLADTLCGTAPEQSTSGTAEIPQEEGVMPRLAADALETERAVASAHAAIDRIMRTFGI